MAELVHIDGSWGEGGGQVLRSALALSLVTGQPFHLVNIRAGRNKPGLGRQHLTCVAAASQVGQARVQGDRIGSLELFFTPQGIYPGSYCFSVGTAGSCTLVLQAVLPPLLLAERPTVLVLEGGTHNPQAPPFEFLQRSFIPIISKMGPIINVKLERYGFFPAGGGKIVADITPTPTLDRIEITRRGEIKSVKALVLLSRLPRHIGQREVKTVAELLGWPPESLVVEEVHGSSGPGNVVMLEVESENVTEVFTGFGMKGVPAEKVAQEAAEEAKQYLDSAAAVGRRLADQLLLPLALSGGGRFTTLPLSLHSQTNIEIIKEFLPVEITTTDRSDGTIEVEISEGSNLSR
ncbi:MAG: RNA 3'-terminal phosphate cyclase [Thermodesulfobacteriota bacterium]